MSPATVWMPPSEEQRRLAHVVAAFDASRVLDRATSPPGSWYTDPSLARLEDEAVFGRSWQPVGRVDQLDAPGAYLSGQHGRLPWLVVRGEDSSLSAFVNVCRHKAAQVITGSGCAESFVCPYHGWTYGLDGALRTAPRLGGVRDFDRTRMGLHPLRVETWGPLVFVNADPQAPALSASLSPLDAELPTAGWCDLTWVERRAYDVKCNWKVYCDNYLDGGYHIAHMHPTLDAQLDMDTYRTRLFDGFSIQTSVAANAPDARIDFEPGSRIGDGSLYAFVYPNLMINRYGPVVDTNLVLPDGPDRCRVVFDFWFEQTLGEPARRYIRKSLEQSEVTQREDIAVSESVQVGMGSGHYGGGRYVANVEHGVHHFHGRLAADLCAGLDRVSRRFEAQARAEPDR